MMHAVPRLAGRLTVSALLGDEEGEARSELLHQGVSCITWGGSERTFLWMSLPF